MSAGPGSGRPVARGPRRRAPSLLAGAVRGCVIAVVSAVVVVLGFVVQDAVVRLGSPPPGVDASAPGVDAGAVVLTLVVAAVGAAVVGAVIGVLAALVVRWRRLSDGQARAGVVLAAAAVVTAVVAAITQGAVYSEWLWAMVPVSALAGLVLARRLVPAGT